MADKITTPKKVATKVEVKGKSGSTRPAIPTKVQNVLWARAAGRCEFEGCNELLCEDWLTGKTINGSQMAHILPVANSARSKEGQSEELKTDIDNLMLLCYKHHNLIDKSAPDEYPDERLQTMKKKHEERIRRATAVQENKQTLVVMYAANIAHDTPLLNYRDAQLAVSPQYFCAEHSPVRIQMKGATKETDIGYWEIEDKNLVNSIQRLVLEPLKDGWFEHISLFAIAPQPLLVRLGTLLNEKYPVRVFQKIRTPQTWTWQESPDFGFSIIEPEDKIKQPVAIFAISADAIIKRTEAFYHGEASIWVLTVEHPDMNILLSENQLTIFRTIARTFIEQVSKSTAFEEIHVHMAMPVSCAVELGRVWMPKAHKAMLLFDNCDKSIDEALKIENN